MPVPTLSHLNVSVLSIMKANRISVIIAKPMKRRSIFVAKGATVVRQNLLIA